MRLTALQRRALSRSRSKRAIIRVDLPPFPRPGAMTCRWSNESRIFPDDLDFDDARRVLEIASRAVANVLAHHIEDKQSALSRLLKGSP